MEVDESDIIHFPYGVFGFEDMKRFVVINFDAGNAVGDGTDDGGESDESAEGGDGLLCLQSLDDAELAFVILNPFIADAAYEPKLADSDMSELRIGDATPVSFYAITVVHENLTESTVNLKCPIVINCESRTAKQVILDSDRYSLRHPLVPGDGGALSS